MYKQRLMREAIEASKKKFSEFLLMFNETDLLSWEAFIQGPSETPYANYIFLVKINLTS
jgi:ubiquitin-protein ligase